MDPATRISVYDDEGADWDQYVSNHAGGTLYHLQAWRSIISSEFGVDTHYFCARDPGGKIVGVLPLVRLRSWLFGDFLVSLPYVNYGGSLAAGTDVDDALMEAACDLARQLCLSHIEFRDTRPRNGNWPVRTDKVTMVMDLPSTADELRRTLGAKIRAQIKRPEREGATVAVGGAELTAAFYAVFSRNMRDLGTPVYRQSFFRRIRNALPGIAEFVVVSVGGTPAAAGLLLHHRGRSEIPWASSLRSMNHLGVNMLLYWECLRSSIQRGSTQFDFGRSTVGASTFRFKEQWGAKPRQLYWHYWLRDGGEVPNLSPSSPKYALAIRAWQRLPLPVANAVGPLIVRYLP